MAGQNGNDDTRQHNSRLETFLKHALEFDTYERIRAHESCIVISEKENRAFKFVILCDTWIYLIDNAPDKLSQKTPLKTDQNLIRIIHLRDIVSLSEENDYPDFLSGEERENTQHLIIKYWTDEKPKKAKKEKKSEPGAAAASAAAGDKSANRTDRDFGATSESERSTKTLQDANELSLLSARSSRSIQSERSATSSVAPKNALSVTARQGVFRRSFSARSSTHRVSFDPLVTERLTLTDRPLTVATVASDGTAREEPTSDKDDAGTKQMSPGKKGSTRKTKNGKSSGRTIKLTNSLDDRVLREALKEKEKLSAVATADKELNGQYEQPVMNGADSPDNGTLQSVPEIVVVPPLDLRGICDTPRSILRTSLSYDANAANGDVCPRTDLRVGILHLYILNGNSSLLTLINCAWNSCLIRGMLELDPAFINRRSIYPPKVCSEKLETRFNQLKSDLFHPHNKLSDIFMYIRELRDGTERNFVLKKFFWKTPEPFVFLVNQLQLYLPAPNNSVIDGSRADQLEVVLVIIETLSLMLRESEIFVRRMQSLKNTGGKTLRQLVNILICEPQNVDDLDADDEGLLEEFTARGTVLLFELITVAQQASWCDVPGSFLHVPWLVDIVELISVEQLTGYLTRLVRQALCLVSCTRHKPLQLVALLQEAELEPDEALLVYHQFFVLDILTFNSDLILQILREKFYEEFKFYVRLAVMEKKLSTRYVLRSEILRLISIVVDRILHDSQTSRFAR